MKFPKGVRLDKICAKEKARYSFDKVKLDLTNRKFPRLEATDGHMAVIIPLMVEEDEELPELEAGKDLLIPSAAIKAAATMKSGAYGKLANATSLRIESGFVVVRGLDGEQRFKLDAPEAGLFPRVRAVIPDESTLKDPVSIAINANYLLEVANCLNSGGLVQLTITENNMVLVKSTCFGKRHEVHLIEETSKNEFVHHDPVAVVMLITDDK